MQTTSNHMEWDLERRENVPTPPSAIAAPDFAHNVGDVLHCPGEYDTMLHCFWLFMVKSQPCLSWKS